MLVALLLTAAACSNAPRPSELSAGPGSTASSVSVGSGPGATVKGVAGHGDTNTPARADGAPGNTDNSGSVVTTGGPVEAIPVGRADPSGAAPGGIGGPGNRTGVKKTELRIGVTGYFPGNVLIASDLQKAFNAYADQVNAAGGVHGRRLVFDIVDTGDVTSEGGVDAAKQVEGRVLLNCECQGADNAVGAGAYLDSRGVPHFQVTATDAIAQQLKHGYVLAPTTEGFSLRTLEYMAVPLKLRGKKIGMVRSNNSVWQPGEAVYKTYSRELGMEVGPIRVTEASQASFVSEMRAMQEAGVEGIFCFCSLEVLGMVRDGKSLGYEPIIAGPTFSFDIISQAGGGSLDGFRSVRLGGTVDLAGYAAFRKAVRDRYGSEPLSDGFIFWGYAQFLVEAARLAGPDPTRARVENAMTTVQSLDTKGAIPPVTYGPNDRIGTTAMLPVRCCNENDRWISEGPYAESFR